MKRQACWTEYQCRDRSCPVYGDHIVGDFEQMRIPLGDAQAWREGGLGPVEALSCEYFRNLRERARGKRAVDRTLDIFLERALRRSASFQRRLALFEKGGPPQIDELNLLGQFSQLIPTLKSVDEVCFALLTVITASQGLGFNRAMLFWLEENQERIVGHCAIGPADHAEAHHIWTELARQEPWLDLRELVQRGLQLGDPSIAPLARKVRGISLSVLRDAGGFVQATRVLQELQAEELTGEADREVVRNLDLEHFITLPLQRQDRSLGFIVVDNRYSGDSILPERVDILQVLTRFAASILDNLLLRESLQISLRRAQATAEVLQEIRRRVARAEKLAAGGELSAVMAHEIRNPLTAIGGFSRRLQRSPNLSESDREAASVILEESLRLDEILGRLLHRAQREELQFRATDLNAEVRGILQLFKDRVGEAGIAADAVLQQPLPRVPLDANRFRQVILNLLQNAIEAIDEEGSIRILTESEEDWVLLRVQDSGCGMDAELQKKIFRAFYTTKSDGTGLGLALSQRIIRQHGGELSVTSEPGTGTCFTVRLPLKGPQQEALDDEARESAS